MCLLSFEKQSNNSKTVHSGIFPAEQTVGGVCGGGTFLSEPQQTSIHLKTRRVSISMKAALVGQLSRECIAR